MALNAHRVFAGPANDQHYLAALTLADKRRQTLSAARDVCREAIRAGLRNWSSVVNEVVLFNRALASVAPSSLRPKFRMQGSFAYHTLNDPAHKPPQEIDLDDGVFVPVSFLSNHGQNEPALISAGYFQAVEAALLPVCNLHGWTLVTDKTSCVRVELDAGAHIDFALYAIPDKEFSELVEARMSAMSSRDRTLALDAAEFAEPVYRGLREDEIMLAHREEGWKPSDPRKLEAWFQDAIRAHEDQLRRICRYLKGWRDFHWEACRLSSISLMACVVTVYQEATDRPRGTRDDLALLMVAERLPTLLSARIANPVVSGQFLDEGWQEDMRREFVEKASLLRDRLREAIHGTDSPSQALASLVRAFGDRLPADVSLIQSEEVLAAPTVLTSGLVRQLAGEGAPQQAVKREGERRYG